MTDTKPTPEQMRALAIHRLVAAGLDADIAERYVDEVLAEPDIL
ncbi:MAG: hypothetical protein WAM50_22275 [Pseudolabrys sp.]